MSMVALLYVQVQASNDSRWNDQLCKKKSVQLPVGIKSQKQKNGPVDVTVAYVCDVCSCFILLDAKLKTGILYRIFSPAHTNDLFFGIENNNNNVVYSRCCECNAMSTRETISRSNNLPLLSLSTQIASTQE